MAETTGLKADDAVAVNVDVDVAGAVVEFIPIGIGEETGLRSFTAGSFLAEREIKERKSDSSRKEQGVVFCVFVREEEVEENIGEDVL